MTIDDASFQEAYGVYRQRMPKCLNAILKSKSNFALHAKEFNEVRYYLRRGVSNSRLRHALLHEVYCIELMFAIDRHRSVSDISVMISKLFRHGFSNDETRKMAMDAILEWKHREGLR